MPEVYALRPGILATGFKLMYGQAGAHPGIFRYLAAEGGRVVHLIRRNLLDIVLSRHVAAARELYHAREGDRVAPARIRLETSDLIPALRREERERERARERLARSGLGSLEVVYEDLTRDAGRFVEVLRFLGLAPGEARLRSTLKKLNALPHREVIENYEEVARALESSAFGGFLS